MDLRVVLFIVVAVVVLAWLAPRLHRERASDAGDTEAPDDDDGTGDDGSFDPDAPEGAVELPITGTLDLHTFSPKEVGRLVPDWLDACREKGLLEVRIIHGKGKGVLRRTVHRILDRHPAVESYALAGAGRGDWGATVVRLRPR